MKQAIVGMLRASGVEVTDMGPSEYDKDDDYPDYAEKVCGAVLSSEGDGKGILICRSGNGMARAANKTSGIYAGLCWNVAGARKEMEHGNTNVLCLSAEHTGLDDACRIVVAWLSTPFSGEGRHVRRRLKVEDLEGRNLGRPTRQRQPV
jgi:ribose 5-phosphate isomerase B